MANLNEKVQTNQWNFVVCKNDDLMCIKRGGTGTGKTELHRLSAADNYKKFSLQIPIGLDLTDGKDWAFTMTKEEDLVAMMLGPETESGKLEVHILSKASNYKDFILQTATAIHKCSPHNYSFLMASNNDLVGIKKGPTSGSAKTEVHRLSAADNYTKYNLQTGTGIHYTHFPDFGYQSFCLTPQDDLVIIRMGPQTGSGKTEVHILSKASNYKDFTLHKATALHYTDPVTFPSAWDFGMGSDGDIVCIGRGPSTGSGMTEVHKLCAFTDYDNFSLHIATCLHLTASLIAQAPAPAPTPGPAPTPAPVEPQPISAAVTPKYWANKDVNTNFDARCAIPAGFHNTLQDLLDSTYMASLPDSAGGSAKPEKLQIRLCHRIEDARMWANYSKNLRELQSRGSVAKVSIRTNDWATRNGFELDETVNESFLFWGTTPSQVTGISQDSFKQALVGTKKLWFEQSSQKADELASVDTTFYEGLAAILVCRVIVTEQGMLTSGVPGDLIYPEYFLAYERQFPFVPEPVQPVRPCYEMGWMTQKLMKAAVEAAKMMAQKAIKAAEASGGDTNAGVMATFKKWDADGDGTITRDELKRVMKSINSRFTDQMVDVLLDEVDKNKDGQIDFEEFCAFIGK